MENSELLKNIGRRVRLFRKERGLSQEKLSELANVHPTTISSLELGTVNGKISNYASVAQALGVSFSELVDTSTDYGDVESWREALMLLQKVRTLDKKRRSVYLEAALKLFKKIESI